MKAYLLLLLLFLSSNAMAIEAVCGSPCTHGQIGQSCQIPAGASCDISADGTVPKELLKNHQLNVPNICPVDPEGNVCFRLTNMNSKDIFVPAKSATGNWPFFMNRWSGANNAWIKFDCCQCQNETLKWGPGNICTAESGVGSRGKPAIKFVSVTPQPPGQATFKCQFDGKWGLDKTAPAPICGGAAQITCSSGSPVQGKYRKNTCSPNDDFGSLPTGTDKGNCFGKTSLAKEEWCTSVDSSVSGGCTDTNIEWFACESKNCTGKWKVAGTSDPDDLDDSFCQYPPIDKDKPCCPGENGSICNKQVYKWYSCDAPCPSNSSVSNPGPFFAPGRDECFCKDNETWNAGQCEVCPANSSINNTGTVTAPGRVECKCNTDEVWVNGKCETQTCGIEPKTWGTNGECSADTPAGTKVTEWAYLTNQSQGYKGKASFECTSTGWIIGSMPAPTCYIDSQVCNGTWLQIGHEQTGLCNDRNSAVRIRSSDTQKFKQGVPNVYTQALNILNTDSKLSPCCAGDQGFICLDKGPGAYDTYEYDCSEVPKGCPVGALVTWKGLGNNGQPFPCKAITTATGTHEEKITLFDPPTNSPGFVGDGEFICKNGVWSPGAYANCDCERGGSGECY